MHVFTNIGELLTLGGVVDKQGRKPKESDLGIIKNAVMVADRGKVVWTGTKAQYQKSKKKLGIPAKAKSINVKGRTIIPGLVECHTHSVFAGDRAHEFEWRNQGMSYEEIGQKGGGILSTVKATRKASLPALQKSLQGRVNRFIDQGVTLLEVKSGYGLSAASEIKMLKAIRSIKKPDVVSTFLGAHALPPEFKSHDRYIEHLIEDVLPKVVKQKLADRADVFIEKGYFTPGNGRDYLAACKVAGLDVCAHTEQLYRTEGFKTAIMVGAQSIEHGVQLIDEDVELLSDVNITSVLLPTADFYLRMNYPPARRLIDSGVRVAVATDFNPGSSPSQDISMVGVLSRLEMKMSLPEVIAAYTYNGACALGRSDQHGALVPGHQANFVVLDDSWDRLFYEVGYHPIHSSYWKARPLLKNTF